MSTCGEEDLRSWGGQGKAEQDKAEVFTSHYCLWLSMCLAVYSAQWRNLGWECLLGAMLPVRACEEAQDAEFASRVSDRKDVSCEEDSHLPTFIGLSSFLNRVT